MHKGHRGNPLSRCQILLNKVWGKTRSGVERIFAHWKTLMGLTRAKYKGWDKHQVHFDLMAISYNLARAVKLKSLSTG